MPRSIILCMVVAFLSSATCPETLTTIRKDSSMKAATNVPKLLPKGKSVQGPARHDLTGKKFGRLLVIAMAEDYLSPGGYHCPRWTCQCDCGNIVTMYRHTLTTGDSKSCGCFNREESSKRSKKHGMIGTRAYNVWAAMRSRVLNPNNPEYKNYGARGIKICPRWDEFSFFYADMGDPPPGLSIERKDNNLGYNPSNCIWADDKTQGRNRRCNRMVTFNGETMCVSAWAEKLGVNAHRIRCRIYAGWSIERALTEKIAS